MKTISTITILALLLILIATWKWDAYGRGYLDGYSQKLEIYLPGPGLCKGKMAGLIEKENG